MRTQNERHAAQCGGGIDKSKQSKDIVSIAYARPDSENIPCIGTDDRQPMIGSQRMRTMERECVGTRLACAQSSPGAECDEMRPKDDKEWNKRCESAVSSTT